MRTRAMPGPGDLLPERSTWIGWARRGRPEGLVETEGAVAGRGPLDDGPDSTICGLRNVLTRRSPQLGAARPGGPWQAGAMSSFQEEVPEQSEQLDQLQPEETLDDRGVDDVLDEGYSPPERWRSTEDASRLDDRLAAEESESGDGDGGEYLDDGEVGDRRAGRLVDPNGGIGEDVESELIGEDVGIDGAGASAEEAAVHVVPDEPYDEG